MRRCPKAFIFLSIAVSQGAAAAAGGFIPSLFLFSFGYDYLFFYLREKKRNKKKGNLLSERCGTTAAAAAGQVSIAPPVLADNKLQEPNTQNKQKQKMSRHFISFFFLFLFSNNPTSLAKASDNVNHPYWFNAFLGFEFF